jgi:hypothetical protein
VALVEQSSIVSAVGPAPLLAPVASFQRIASGPSLSEKRELRTSSVINWKAFGRNRHDAQCHCCSSGFIHWTPFKINFDNSQPPNIGCLVSQYRDSLPLSPLLCRFTVVVTLNSVRVGTSTAL